MWLALVEQLFYNQSMEMSTEVHNEPVPIETLTAETIRPGMLVRLEDGRTGRAMANLGIQDPETGLFIDARFNTTKITTDNHRELRERRYDLARQAAARGLRSTLDVGGSQSELEAWCRIIQAQAELALDKSAGRASTEAAKFVARAVDLLPDGSDKGAQTVNNTQINLVDGQLDALIERLQGLRDRRRAVSVQVQAVSDAEVQ